MTDTEVATITGAEPHPTEEDQHMASRVTERQRVGGVLKWEDPPPPRGALGTSRAYEELVATLEAKPGEWALVFDKAPSTGITATFKKYGLECVTRSNPNSNPVTHKVYVRVPKGGRLVTKVNGK